LYNLASPWVQGSRGDTLCLRRNLHECQTVGGEQRP
jgi:hypothetical protein